MSDEILAMRGITKRFAGVTALHDVSLSVRRGEIHAICGENGAGKSTLMKVLSGVHPHGTYDGEIVFAGEPCAFHGVRDSERRGIVIIHQELALCGQLSVAENLFLGNERSRRGFIDWNRTNHEAQALLAEYQRKQRDAMREAEEIISSAKSLAQRQIKEAGVKLEENLARREKASLEKIAQAEAQALAEVRREAVDVATQAASRIIRSQIDGARGAALIDQAIADVEKKLH